MEYVWNEEKLSKMLDKDEKKITRKYSDELQLEINSLRIALNMPVINKVMVKNNNVISKVTSLAASYVFSGDKKLFDIESRKKLSKKEIVNNAYKTMGHKDKKCFSKICKNGMFSISDNKPQTIYLPCQGISLINVSDRGLLSDARNIMHEVAHASYFKNLKYNELENVSMSYLRETLSIFNEMLFIDRLNKHEDIINEQNIFMNNYYEWYKNNDTSDIYGQSFVLAEYLFMLYKKDRARFNKEYNKFKAKLKSSSDEEVIDDLNIEVEKLLIANEKYLRLYKK